MYNIFKIIFIFVAIFSFMLTSYGATYSDCKNLYLNSVYDKASSCFYGLLSKDKNNPDLKLGYANSLFGQKRYKEARLIYLDIIQKHPSSKAVPVAKRGLSMTDSMLKSIGSSKTSDAGNYISEIATAKWGAMPIKVWIQQNEYSAYARKAFIIWQSKTQGAVRFVFIDKRDSANIAVSFKNSIAADNTVDTMGITHLYTDANNMKVIRHADMEIKSVTDTGTKQTGSQIYAVVLHEVGHALGIRGHSGNKFDVMYPSSDNYRDSLSNRDINTIKSMYK